jgi:hypothetical protein
MPATSFNPPPQETPAERDERIRMINARIAAGQAEIDAGNYLELEALEAWLDSDPLTPMPIPKNIVVHK